MVKRLSLKQTKAELEKKQTLDEKKGYLEEVLKKIKGAKLRAKVEALLEETKKHLEHENEFEKGELEKKIAVEVSEVEPTPVNAKPFSEIKYIPRPQRDMQSELEREVRSAKVPEMPAVSIGPPKYIALAGGDYMSFGEAAERAKFLLNAHGIKEMSADEFYRMSPVQKQGLMKTVSEAVGKPLEQYEQLYTIAKAVAIKPEEQKYQARKW